MSFLQFIYPARCISCDRVLSAEETEPGICRRCLMEKKAVFAKEPICLKCGRGLLDETKELCGSCRKKSHPFVSARAVFFYGGGIKKGMYRFKYGGRRAYGRTYADLALRRCGRWLKGVEPDFIVPVPMYLKKERERGYNQAKTLGHALSKATGIPYINCLKRVKSTIPLKLLSPEQRKKNIKGAFILGKADIKYKRILLVDDIYTTGATVDECTRILLEGGAAAVYVFSVCTGTERKL